MKKILKFLRNNKTANFSFVATSDIGCIRQRNEDSYLVINEPHSPYSFFGVADGMGGHEGGSIVSQHVVNEIYKLWFSLEDKSSIGREKLENLILNSLKGSNQWIYNIYSKLKLAKPMGTTFTGILLSQDYFTLFHVGDSRLYISNNERIIQISKDHTWVRAQVRKGLLTEEEACIHPARSVLNNCIGASSRLMLDMKRYKCSPETSYFLSTDGLHNEFTLSYIHQILRFPKPQEALDKLTRATLLQGGRDNLTGIIVNSKKL